MRAQFGFCKERDQWFWSPDSFIWIHVSRLLVPAGSHLLHLSAPADLVASFAEALQVADYEGTELAHEIIRSHRASGPLDALVHRTQVGGLR